MFLNVIDDISNRLGLSYKLDVQKVKDIFDICRYEQAWNVNATSAWCSVRMGWILSGWRYKWTCSQPQGDRHESGECSRVFGGSEILLQIRTGRKEQPQRPMLHRFRSDESHECTGWTQSHSILHTRISHSIISDSSGAVQWYWGSSSRQFWQNAGPRLENRDSEPVCGKCGSCQIQLQWRQ